MNEAAQPRRALVTGAGGFLGANLIRRLIADGHTVMGMVRPGSDVWRLDGISGGLEVKSADLRDSDALGQAVSEAAPDWVFHLAAHGGYSWQRDAAGIFESNVVGTAALLEACREAGCDAFVQTGSSSEYGLKDHAPAEDEPLEPNSAYAVAKAAATLYARHLAVSGGLPAVTLRLYSAYGPYEDPRRLVPKLISEGLQGRLPPLVGPEISRDFVAVEDVLDALVAAASRPAAGGPGAVYN
ncbi:MAG: NAD-dependent epimerase/dehydratase family protein, partial [Solirubrobacterales bacterium]